MQNKKEFALDVLLPVIYALSECVHSVVYSDLSFLEIPTSLMNIISDGIVSDI